MILRRLGWAVAGVLLLMLLAWALVPRLVRSQGEERLGALLGRPVTLGAVEFRPWSLELTLHDIAIAGTEPGKPLLTVARLHANVQIASLWRRAPIVEALDVDAPVIHLSRLQAGHYDIDDLIQRLTPPPQAQPSEPARFSLNNLQVHDGALSFDDRPVGRVHELKQFELSLPFLSNLPSDVEVKVQPRIAFTLNGAEFDSGAQATPFRPDRAGTLTLKIADLDLAPYLGYQPEALPLRLIQAHVGADLNLAFSVEKDGSPRLALQGEVRAGDLALATPDGQPLLAWQQLVIGLRDVQPLARQVQLGTVQLDGAELHVSRDAAGQINLLHLLPPAATPAPAATASAPAPASASASPSASSPANVPPAWRFGAERVALNQARVLWTDASLSPALAWRLDEVAVEARGLQWPITEAVPLGLKAALRTQGADGPVAARLEIEGQATDRSAHLDLRLNDLGLPFLAPYVAQVLAPKLEGSAGLQASLDWAGGDAAPKLQLHIADAHLDALRLTAPGRGAELASLKQLRLAGAEIDLEARTASIGKLSLQAPAAQLARGRDGRLNVSQWLVAAPASADRGPHAGADGAPPAAPAPAASVSASASAPASALAGADPPWQVDLREFALDAGRIRWTDEHPAAGYPAGAPPVALEASGLQIAVQGLHWDGAPTATAASKTPVLAKVQVALRLANVGATPEVQGSLSPNSAALLEWRGQLGLAPLQVRGAARVERLPVHAFQPYLGSRLNLTLERALFGYRGEVAATQAAAGLGVQAAGDVLISDVAVLSKPASADATPDELLNWQHFSLTGVKLKLEPGGRPSVDIAQAELGDFYSRLVITEQGRFNLQDVAAGGGGDAALEPNAAASAPLAIADPVRVAVPASAPGPAASAASAVATAAPGRALPLDISVGGTKLVNGRVDFTDRFVRPNYSAALTELNGTLGAFRSGTREMATLDLRGRAAGTAQLEISGQVNPTADPLALDIHAKATDLELAPLSPYAGKYAGYAIERGKLSMDVAYNIQPDGRLEAKNQVILNQLTFGERIESPTATKLPVLLAVALLKDRHGVIDINLPVSGSINDPQFSVGGIILKVIVNLLTKALTAPFALLAGGGGDDLSVVDFKPGTAAPTDAGLAALDKVAQALTERPALKMTVTGASDPVAELEAYRAAALEQRLRVERRRELVRQGAAVDAPVTLTAEDRARLVKAIYAQTKLPDKPRNLVGLAKDLPVAEMEGLLRANTSVGSDAMRELALQRGLAVRDALVAKGLPSERLFLAAPKLHNDGEAGWTPQVQLSLTSD